MSRRVTTHVRFDDYPRNGEGMSIYEPDTDCYTHYPDGVELVFHIETVAAYLDRDDIRRLRDTLTTHLDDNY